MAQAIICHNDQGLVLATDSLALGESPLDAAAERATAGRLFPLGERAAILNAGAPVGAELCAELAQWLTVRGLTALEDILAVGRDFMAEAFSRYLRAQGHDQGNGHLHFLIGGYLGRASAPFQAILWHTEAGELPLRETQLGRVFTLPRRLVFEGRLTRQIAEGAGLWALAKHCQTELMSMAERNPVAVGGPLQFAIITASETRFLNEIPTGEGDDNLF